jgi:regulator of replication initiation timing
MDTELRILEKKLNTLFEHTRALRMANEALRRDLVRVREENQALTRRTQEASARLEAALSRLPEASS